MTIATDPSKAGAAIGAEQWLRMYRRMVMIRLFEEQVNELYTRALMPGLDGDGACDRPLLAGFTSDVRDCRQRD